MSNLSDKNFLLIILVLGVIYFYFKGNGSNDKVDLSQVSFVVDGNTKTLTDYQGQNVVVNFYASWCRPCMKELPAMAQTATQWKDVTFLWLNNENESIVSMSKQEFKHDTFYLLSNSFKSIGIESIPYTAVLNKKGEVVFSKSGQLNWESESFKKEILSKLD